MTGLHYDSVMLRESIRVKKRQTRKSDSSYMDAHSSRGARKLRRQHGIAGIDPHDGIDEFPTC